MSTESLPNITMVTPVLNGFGFKATYSDLTCCNGFQYEIGKVYKHTGKLELCSSGFHLCKQLHHTFAYYNHMKSNRFFVVSYNDTTDNCNVADKDNTVEYPKVVTNAIRLETEIKVEDPLEMSDMVKRYPTEHMLLYLARYGDSPYVNEVFNQLLDYGADVHAHNDLALPNACLWGYIKVVKLLLERGANVHANYDEALQKASKGGHIEIVKLLLDKGADVNANDDQALKGASAYGHTEVVRLLLSEGADVNACDDYSLRSASFWGYTKVVRLLLEAGADVHAQNDYALRRASFHGHTDVVKLLISNGACLISP